MFSLGFQKALRRGFEPDDEVVRPFSLKVRILLRPMKIDVYVAFPRKSHGRRHNHRFLVPAAR